MIFSYHDEYARSARTRHRIVTRKGHTIWLFAGSDAGGRTGATLLTVTASCKRHGVEQFAYLRDVLTRIAATPVNALDQFLPDRWKAVHPRPTLPVVDA